MFALRRLSKLPRSAQRIDPKSLKHDAFFDFTSRATSFVSANMSSVLGVTVAVIAAIVLATFWARSRSEKASEADLRASALVSTFTAGQYEASLELSSQIQSTYGGTRAAVVANYVKGKAELELHRDVEAEASLRAYLAQSDKAPFYEDAARRALAASLEGQARYAEAGAAYEEAARGLPETLADEAMLDAARCYRLAGDADRARSLLTTLVEKDAGASRRARIELAALDAAGTTAPVWVQPEPGTPVVTPPDTNAVTP
jgi:hypothetical protein